MSARPYPPRSSSPLRQPAPARPLGAAAGLAALLLACAGPDLGPARGTHGPWWIPDPQLSAAVGAVQDAQRYHAQLQAPRPVHFSAAGEREALLRAAGEVLRKQGLGLRVRLGDEPLRTVRQDAGLEHGTVGSRPAVLTRSFALSVEPELPAAPAGTLWQLTLWTEVERCARASASEPEAQRPCAPLRDISPEQQQELEALGETLRAALGSAGPP